MNQFLTLRFLQSPSCDRRVKRVSRENKPRVIPRSVSLSGRARKKPEGNKGEKKSGRRGWRGGAREIENTSTVSQLPLSLSSLSAGQSRSTAHRNLSLIFTKARHLTCYR